MRIGESAERNRKRVVERYRERVAGYAPGQFDKMCAEQNGLCAICGNRRRLVADHCHVTHLPRQPICNGCNSRVGYEEASQLRPKVLEYIAKWKKNHADIM